MKWSVTNKTDKFLFKYIFLLFVYKKESLDSQQNVPLNVVKRK